MRIQRKISQSQRSDAVGGQITATARARVAFTEVFGLIVLVVTLGLIALAAVLWAKIKGMPPLVEYDDGFGDRRVGPSTKLQNIKDARMREKFLEL